jgi:hypothetical protein
MSRISVLQASRNGSIVPEDCHFDIAGRAAIPAWGWEPVSYEVACKGYAWTYP